MTRQVNVLALVKESERYVFLYDDDSRQELFRTLARYAADDGMSLTWQDAASLSQRVARQKADEEAESGGPRIGSSRFTLDES